MPYAQYGVTIFIVNKSMQQIVVCANRTKNSQGNSLHCILDTLSPDLSEGNHHTFTGLDQPDWCLTTMNLVMTLIKYRRNVNVVQVQCHGATVQRTAKVSQGHADNTHLLHTMLRYSSRRRSTNAHTYIHTFIVLHTTILQSAVN